MNEEKYKNWLQFLIAYHGVKVPLEEIRCREHLMSLLDVELEKELSYVYRDAEKVAYMKFCAQYKNKPWWKFW